MTDHAWPATFIPASSEWRLIANAASFGVRVYPRSGDRWGCTLTLPVLRRDDAYTLRAFLAKLPRRRFAGLRFVFVRLAAHSAQREHCSQ